MKLIDYLKVTSTKEIFKLLFKAGLSSAPFTGGAATLWSEIDNQEQKQKFNQILEYLLIYFEQDKNEKENEELKKLLSTKITEVQKYFLETSVDEFKSLLAQILRSNIPRELTSIKIDSKTHLKESMRNLHEKQVFTKELEYGLGKFQFYDDYHEMEKLAGKFISSNLGIGNNKLNVDKHLKDSKHPINIAFSPIMLSVSAIFFYLKYEKGYNLNLIYSFAHSLELSERIIDKSIGSIQVCVMADAPSLKIINNYKSPKFHFVSFLPKSEQKIVSPKSSWYKNRNKKEGEFVFIGDRISTTFIHFEEWIRKGVLDSKKIKTESREPHESLQVLLSQNPEKKILVWAPHWQIYEKLKVGEIYNSTPSEEYWYDCMLFFQHSFSRNKSKSNAFLLAVKDAWFSLLNPLNLEKTIEHMISDENFVEYLKRYTGYYNLK